MKLTKVQINKIKTAQDQANKAEFKANILRQYLADVISKALLIDGDVDYLPGDGFGFSIEGVGKNTHITIDKIIELGENGEDINGKVILDNLSI